MQTLHGTQYDHVHVNVNPVKRGDVFRVDYPPEVPRLPRRQIMIVVFLLLVGSGMASVGLSVGLCDVVIFVISSLQ